MKRRAALSCRRFVEEVRVSADAAESGEAPIFEEGSEGIRIMSVHKAKSLEFPVVILADITAKICQSHPGRYIDSSSSLCAVPLAGCEPLDLQERGELELAREQLLSSRRSGAKPCTAQRRRRHIQLRFSEAGRSFIMHWPG
jgi:superfamily I DNA/RNA helicase